MMYVLAAIGGLLPDLLRIAKSRREAWNEWTDLSKYIFGTIIQIGLGILMVFIFKPDNNLDALLYGYTAPQILTSLAASFRPKGSGIDAKDMSDESQPMKRMVWFWRY